MLKKIYFMVLLLGANIYAGVPCCSPVSPFYARVEVGGSFSHGACVFADPLVWDPAQEGYNNSLGRVPLFGAEIGYHVNSWLALGFSATHRSNFRYCKFQTPTSVTNTPNFLGAKTRFFDFDNTSFMFDLFFNRSGYYSCYALRCCNFAWVPYIGVGVGLSKNTVYNFHSVTEVTRTVGNFTTNEVASILTYFTRNRVGWHAQIGIDTYVNACVSFGVGYRYFDGGRLLTNNFIVDKGTDISVSRVVPAWCAKFKTHELVGTLTLDF